MMSMKLEINMHKCISQMLTASVLLFSGMVNAATVTLPALDIAAMGGDAGASVTTNSFTLEATAFTIITNADPIDIADETFTLTSTSGTYDPTADFGYGHGMFSGTFSISGGLLSGTFSDLEVFGYMNGIDFDFDGLLTFASGSLKGGFNTGVLDGIIDGSKVTAKLGTIAPVPVPAAAWLFGSGLIGLVFAARRKV